MSGINKAIILGNLGQDPEVKYMPNGNAVANVTIATSESWKDKNTGEKVEKTEWHRVVFFRRLAEIVGEYLKKGSKVYIEGKLQTRKWQDKDGKDCYTTEIVAREMQMLDSRGQAENKSAATNNPAEHHSGAVEQKNPTYGGSAGQTPDPGFSDDIPF